MKYFRRFSVAPWLFVAVLTFTFGLTFLGCSSVPGLSGVALACETGDAAGVGFADDAAGDDRQTVYVNIRNFRFNPSDIVVPVGTRVVFVNEDEVEHNILQSATRRVGAEPPLFESPVLAPGQQWGFVFTQPGEHPIVCTVNGHQLMGMVGRVVVIEK